MTRLKKNTSLSLSLSTCRSVDALWFSRKDVHVPVSLSLSLDGPDQIRMEFRKECFVNLKIWACDRKYAKCRAKADAHDKMGF